MSRGGFDYWATVRRSRSTRLNLNTASSDGSLAGTRQLNVPLTHINERVSFYGCLKHDFAQLEQEKKPQSVCVALAKVKIHQLDEEIRWFIESKFIPFVAIKCETLTTTGC